MSKDTSKSDNKRKQTIGMGGDGDNGGKSEAQGGDATSATPALASCTRDHTREVKISEDPKNYRRHNARNLSLIEKSLTDCGAGRSIVADSSGVVIGGNGTLRMAKKRGIKQKIVHTNGDELVVVVRDDIAPDDPRRKELALADNATSDSSDFDFEALSADFSAVELSDWDVSPADLDGGESDTPAMTTEEIDQANIYSQKIDGLIYEPTGEDVPESELTDKGKYDELIAAIDAADIPDRVKDFLRVAATRHIVFNYARVADYYANAPAEVQALMEASGLVIIDYQSAIKHGFVKLAQKIDEMREADYAAKLAEDEDEDSGE